MGFPIPEVTKCCFFFPLRTASLIIGYLSATLSLLGLALLITAIVLISRLVGITPPTGGPRIDSRTALRAYITFGAQSVVYLIHFIVSVVLVVGAHKEKARLLRICWRYMGVVLVLNLLTVCTAAMLHGFFVTFGQLLFAAFAFYFVLVVRSYYFQQLKRETPPAGVELTSRTDSPLMVNNQWDNPRV